MSRMPITASLDELRAEVLPPRQADLDDNKGSLGKQRP